MSLTSADLLLRDCLIEMCSGLMKVRRHTSSLCSGMCTVSHAQNDNSLSKLM